MLIKRNRKEIKRIGGYWWVSEDLGLDMKIIKPGVPKNILTQRQAIDTKTPRTLIYTSLDDAISVQSMGERKLTGMTLGVYKFYLPPDEGITPELRQCPYRDTLDGEEVWLYRPWMCEKIADIKIGPEIEKRPWKYGNPSHAGSAVIKTHLSRYSWAEILPEWDKKGKTKKL